MSDSEIEEELAENPDPEADLADPEADLAYPEADLADPEADCSEVKILATMDDVAEHNAEGDNINSQASILDMKNNTEVCYSEEPLTESDRHHIESKYCNDFLDVSDHNQVGTNNNASVNSAEHVSDLQAEGQLYDDDDDDFAAEDEQYMTKNDVQAHCGFEPESSNYAYCSYTERGDGAEGDEAGNHIEHEGNNGYLESHHRTESAGQMTPLESEACSYVAVCKNNKNNKNDLVEFQHENDLVETQQENDLVETRVDGAYGEDVYLNPESELGENRALENEPTESDQENEKNIIAANEHIADQGSASSVVFGNHGSVIIDSTDCVTESNHNGLLPEDEILCAASNLKTMANLESFQPECDQNSEDSIFLQNKTCNLLATNNGADMRNESSEKLVSSSQHLNDVIKAVETGNKTENVDEGNTANDGREDITNCNSGDMHVSFERNEISVLDLSKDKGAIPKQKKCLLDKRNVEQKSFKAFDAASISIEDSSKARNDSEEELLSELDATLVSSGSETLSNQNYHETEMCSIKNEVITYIGSDTESTCDQCFKNNLKCSFKMVDHKEKSDRNREISQQLYQAKQLLMDRECEISRLKADLTDHRLRCETLKSERDACHKEVECLQKHNSDQLYIPQIKELEYTIAQQSSEIQSLKDKLVAHDAAAKRAIATLQNEMKLRIDQVTKTYEDVNKEKDSMVIKFAQSEQKYLEYQKVADRWESKLKEMEKEREGFLQKMKTIKDAKNKLAADWEAKNSEINNLNKDMEKLKDLVSSADLRVKWAQNKLKAELEAHKETKNQLEKTSVKVKEAKEETQQIRIDCQRIVKTYQESEEVKSNTLDKELKQKECELLENQVLKNNFELAHVKTQRELEHVKCELRDANNKLCALSEKMSSVEAEKEKAAITCEKYGEVIEKQKREVRELREKVESLVPYKADFNSAQELIKNLDSDIAELKISNKEMTTDLEVCRVREIDRLELTSKLSRINAELQSENSDLSNKLLTLTGELQSVKMENQEVETRLQEITDALAREHKLRQEETNSLNIKLAEKCKYVEEITRKLEEEKDEIKTLKRKHTNHVKDLTRQLQQARRRLDNYDVSTNGDKDTTSMGSRTSSNGSLNTLGIVEQSNLHAVQASSGHQMGNSLHPNVSPQEQFNFMSRDYPVITEQFEVDKQTLIDKIIKLQQTMARKNEKLEFMEDHICQLIDEIQKKNKIIQSYILKEESGVMTSNSRDQAKAEISRKHSIMGSVYSSQSSDVTMTFELSLEINRKLQAVLEDTILKNMTLKESLDTLGQEIARLSQENRALQIHLRAKSQV